MANTIKIKRGLSSNIDNTTLAQGELAITTDTNELYVGKASGKEKINVQANYSQNDKKAADYIKNRPFHEVAGALFSGEVTLTKEANSTKETFTIPFSDSFKASDLKYIWMVTLSVGSKQYKLYRWNWDYERYSYLNYSYRPLSLDSVSMELFFNNDGGLNFIMYDEDLSDDDYSQAISVKVTVILAPNVKTEQLCLAPIQEITQLTTDPN